MCSNIQPDHDVYFVSISLIYSWPSSAQSRWVCKVDAEKTECLVQGQGNGNFVEGVQKAIASELQVGIADMTNQEKKQLMMKYSKRKW